MAGPVAEDLVVKVGKESTLSEKELASIICMKKTLVCIDVSCKKKLGHWKGYGGYGGLADRYGVNSMRAHLMDAMLLSDFRRDYTRPHASNIAAKQRMIEGWSAEDHLALVSWIDEMVALAGSTPQAVPYVVKALKVRKAAVSTTLQLDLDEVIARIESDLVHREEGLGKW